MGRVYRFAICCLLTTACRFLVDPCVTETRYVSHVLQWNVVCLERQADGLQTCLVWPTPPMSPDWVGTPSQVDSGYPFRPVIICKETRITDTPI